MTLCCPCLRLTSALLQLNALQCTLYIRPSYATAHVVLLTCAMQTLNLTPLSSSILAGYQGSSVLNVTGEEVV